MSQESDNVDPQKADPQDDRAGDADPSASDTTPPFVEDGAISSARPEGSVPGQPDAQDADRDELEPVAPEPRPGARHAANPLAGGGSRPAAR